tara:strand:- start:1699 stop:2490 length:792 start_codon:yes stop_codon:yes gene_type:complete
MISKRKIGIIVIARMQSDRFPGKALEKIGNYFSLELCLLNCKKIKKVDKIILATTRLKSDKVLIKTFKKKFNIFAGESKNVLKRMLDVCKKFNFKDIVRVTGDCPFISPDIIEILIKKHQLAKADMTIARKSAAGTYGEVYKVNALKKILRMSNNSGYTEYLPYYFLHNKKNFTIKMVDLPLRLQRNYRITLDYKKDLIMFNQLIKKSTKKPQNLTTLDIFKILDKNPKITKINAGLKLKYLNKYFQKKLKKSTKFLNEKKIK